jgi:hypothetical protein
VASCSKKEVGFSDLIIQYESHIADIRVGIHDECLFARASSAVSVRKLQHIFSTAPSERSEQDLAYGMTLDWNNHQYSAKDAATLLLPYLRLLPEPVVPHICYPIFRLLHEKIVATSSNERTER